MTDRFSPLAVRGFGLAGAAGRSRAEIDAALAAETSIYRGHRGFFDNAFDNLVCAFESDTQLSDFESRALALTGLALADCLTGILTPDQPSAPVVVTVLLPEKDPQTAMPRDRVIGYSVLLHERLMDLLQQAGIAVVGWRFVNHGHAALGVALCGEALPPGADHLIIGADSFCDPGRLAAASGHGLLFSAHDKWGFVPGEAAGALWLSPHIAVGDRAPIILGAGTAKEAICERDERATDHASLSAAVRSACDGIGQTSEQVRLWVSDFNNGRYRAAELAYAVHRAAAFWLSSDCAVAHGPMTFGDCGAATGFVGVQRILATEPGVVGIVSGSALTGARSAFVVRNRSKSARVRS